jgi:hypothetical protein
MVETISKKNLIEILKQFPDDIPIYLEYNGWDFSNLDRGDYFGIYDIECTDKAIYLEFM